MKKKKGFTLIELLTIIVILSILALVTVPIVNNIIKNVSKAKFKQNAVGLLNLVKVDRENSHTVGDGQLQVYDILEEENAVIYNNNNIGTGFNGEIDGNGVIVVNTEGDQAIRYSNGEWCAYKNYTDTVVKITRGECDLSTSFKCEDIDIQIVPENRWSQYKLVTRNTNSSCKEVKYRINGSEYKEFNEPIRVENNDARVDIVTLSQLEIETETNLVVDKIDNTRPSSIYAYAIPTKRSITVSAIAVDEESEIAVYAFSIDDGETWTTYGPDNSYTFDNLEPGTYNVRAKAYNGTYGSEGAIPEKGEIISERLIVPLVTCPVPSITYKNNDGSKWTQSKVLSIDYGEDIECTMSYSLDGGSTFIGTDQAKIDVTIEENNTNFVAQNSYNGKGINNNEKIINIDRTKPEVSEVTSVNASSSSITIVGRGRDSESDIYGYKFSIDNGNSWSKLQTNNTYTTTELPNNQNSFNVKVKVYNNAFNNGSDKNEEIGASESTSRSTTLVACPAPDIKVTPTGWTDKKTITITYTNNSECPVKKYSLDNGNTYQTTTNNTYSTTINENTTIYAFQGVNEQRGTTVTEKILYIDAQKPTATIKVKYNGSTITNNGTIKGISGINMTCSAGGSGIKKYTLYIRKGNSLLGTENISSTSSSVATAFNPATYGISNNSTITLGVTCTSGANVEGTEVTQNVVYIKPTTTTTTARYIVRTSWGSCNCSTMRQPYTDYYSDGTASSGSVSCSSSCTTTTQPYIVRTSWGSCNCSTKRKSYTDYYSDGTTSSGSVSCSSECTTAPYVTRTSCGNCNCSTKTKSCTDYYSNGTSSTRTQGCSNECTTTTAKYYVKTVYESCNCSTMRQPYTDYYSDGSTIRGYRSCASECITTPPPTTTTQRHVVSDICSSCQCPSAQKTCTRTYSDGTTSKYYTDSGCRSRICTTTTTTTTPSGGSGGGSSTPDCYQTESSTCYCTGELGGNGYRYTFEFCSPNYTQTIKYRSGCSNCTARQ